jgi:hypothetical protein
MGRPADLRRPPDRSTGEPVSGNVPEVLGTKRIGTVFNTTTADKKLKMEAWIDVELCEERAPDLAPSGSRMATPIEISVGTFVDTDDSTGRLQRQAVYRRSVVGASPRTTWRSLPEGDYGRVLA